MSNEMVEVDVDHVEPLISSYKTIIDDEVYFLPKSQCEYEDDDVVILVPEWLAIKEGLV